MILETLVETNNLFWPYANIITRKPIFIHKELRPSSQCHYRPMTKWPTQKLHNTRQTQFQNYVPSL